MVIQNEAASSKTGTPASIAVFGFSYKKNTSDTRSSPCVSVVAKLAKSGFNVKVHDPQVTQGGFEFEMAAQGHQYFIGGNDSENIDPNGG